MVASPEKATSETNDVEHCACPAENCAQNYSPDIGYFSLEDSRDHWSTTGSSSVRINRNPTQVICDDEPNSLMFIEIFDAEADVHIFRCPQKECGKTLKIPANAPPAYWLCEGFFKLK